MLESLQTIPEVQAQLSSLVNPALTITNPPSDLSTCALPMHLLRETLRPDSLVLLKQVTAVLVTGWMLIN